MVSDMGLVMRIRPGARVWGLSVWRETVYLGAAARTTVSYTNPEAPRAAVLIGIDFVTDNKVQLTVSILNYRKIYNLFPFINKYIVVVVIIKLRKDTNNNRCDCLS